MFFDDLLKKAEATYADLKQQARERFPVGHWYAMVGKIVADDKTEKGLRQQVRDFELNDDRVMIEQVHPAGPVSNIFPGFTMYMAMAQHLIRVMIPEPDGEE